MENKGKQEVEKQDDQEVENEEKQDKIDKERLKIWLGFARFILGTVALGVLSTIINHQIQQREIEIKEQELAGTFLEHALQEDVGVRRRFAEYFATVTRSDVLRERWTEYSSKVEAEYAKIEGEKLALERVAQQESLDAKERERLDTKIAVLEQALSPRPLPDEQLLPPRVYFHIRNESQRERAQEAALILNENAIVVPGIERRNAGPRASELRYFRAKEREDAQSILNTLVENGFQIELKYVAGYEASTQIRPRHYELWFSAGAI